MQLLHYQTLQLFIDLQTIQKIIEILNTRQFLGLRYKDLIERFTGEASIFVLEFSLELV
jgi:hypothetical protein